VPPLLKQWLLLLRRRLLTRSPLTASPEGEDRVIVGAASQLEALLQSTSPLRVLEMRTNDYDAAVLGRVLRTRRVLSVSLGLERRNVPPPPLKFVVDRPVHSVVELSLLISYGLDASHVPPIIMAFPALINLAFSIFPKDEDGHRALQMLCETLSAGHAPRLEVLSVEAPALNHKTAALLAPVFQKLTGLTDLSVDGHFGFDDAAVAALISAMSCVRAGLTRLHVCGCETAASTRGTGTATAVAALLSGNTALTDLSFSCMEDDARPNARTEADARASPTPVASPPHCHPAVGRGHPFQSVSYHSKLTAEGVAAMADLIECPRIRTLRVPVGKASIPVLLSKLNVRKTPLDLALPLAGTRYERALFDSVRSARPFIAITIGVLDTAVAPALERIAQYDIAWTAAVVALSFVRTKHPHALSILPLIPTIIAFVARRKDPKPVEREHTTDPAKRFLHLSRPCDALVHSVFGRSCTAAAAPAAPAAMHSALAVPQPPMATTMATGM
jgi:hypothetical protein